MNIASWFHQFWQAPNDRKSLTAGMPIKRVSQPSDASALTDLMQSGPLPYISPRKFPVEVYDLLSFITTFNPDVRQVVRHVVELGNTGHIVTLRGGTEAAIDAAVARINAQAKAMYPFAAGVDGLVNALFSQIARFGGTATEWVPNQSLTGIEQAFVVPIGQIRWIPRTDNMGYTPVQKPVSSIVGQDLQSFIHLNPRTFHYMNLETDEDSPYAMPPFIAALGPLSVQKNMMDNIKKVVKKLGIMGLLTYSVEPPPSKPGETDEAYQARCLDYLNTMAQQVQGTFSEGMALGFKGSFDFDIKSLMGDARGITEIFNLNEQQVFSGLGSDPAMHGRTYSTTETYASVMYSKLTSQLRNTQLLVAHTLEFGYGLDLLLAGIPSDVVVAFNPSKALNNLQESQAEMIDIANASALYREGIIDQNGKARYLGFQKPALSEPLPDPSLANDKNLNQRPNLGGPDNEEKASSKQPKQPKEGTQHSARFEFKHGHYTVAVDMNYLDLNGKPVAAQLSASEEDKEARARSDSYRRYLRPGSDDAGRC